MISLRLAERKDLTLLRKIAIETNVDTFAEFNTPENMDAFLREYYNPSRLEEEFEEAGSVCFLAWDEEKLVGFSRLRLNDEAESQLGKNTIELQRLYVHPDHQGKRIGSLLMQNALDYAKECGLEWLWLGVWERNFKAQGFYAKWGFERFGSHVFPMGDDPQTDWLLKKKISRDS